MIRHTRILTYGLAFVAASMPFTGPALACSNVSVDGCPTVEEVDDNAASLTGFWIQSKAKLLWYGDDYAVAPTTTSSTPTATATFFSTVDTEVDGDYSVYARWTTDPNRCTAARHQIFDGGTLLTTVTVNQRQNGGAWRRLGTFRLTPNAIPRVVVNNAGCPAGTYVVADGIRWVKEDNDHNSIVDEPGYELAQSGERTTAVALCSNPASSWSSLASVTVTTPRAHGIVWVHANGISRHVTDDIGRVCIQRAGSTNCASWAPVLDQSSTEVSQGAWDNETRWTVSDTFPATGGSQTYYLRACQGTSTANVDFLWDDFVALYFPTQY